MGTVLHVLLVDDSEDDALLLLRELQQGGYAPVWERVDTAEGLRDALAHRRWDIVLCDYVMPRLSGPAALQLLQEQVPDLPVIIVSGQIGEEFTVAAMRAGACDYVMKDNLHRLSPAVARELSEAVMHRERARAEDALRETEARMQALVDGLDVIVWEGNPATLRFSYVSRHAEELLGYSVTAWIEDAGFWAGHIHPDDRQRTVELRRSAMAQGQDHAVEYRFLAADGRVVWLRDIVRMVLPQCGEPARARGVMVDITERKLVEGEKTALLEVAQDIGSTLELRQILDRVQRRAGTLLACERVATYYRDPQAPEFRLVAHYGVPPEQAANPDVAAFQADQPIAQWLANGHSLAINDIPHQSWLSGNLLERLEIGALLATPLIVRGMMMGVLAAARLPRSRGFNAREVQLLENIAHQVAVALGTAELYRAQQTEARVSTALARVGQELIAALDGPMLLDTLCRLTSAVLECDTSHTVLWDPARQVYTVVAGHGFAPEQWESLRVLKIPRTVLEGLTARLEGDQIEQVVMAEAPSFFPRELPIRYGITAGMYVALRRGDALIGILTAGYRGRKSAFTPEQLRIFRGVAQIGSLALEHARAVEELARANRLKYDFVATMSHELRTPLNVILGYSDLLLEGEFGRLTEEQARVSRRIENSAQQLLELINATLDLSRLEGGRVPLEIQEVDLSHLFQELELETRDLEARSGLRIVWRTPSDLPTLRTDPLKLKVVLKNLVGNAVKFTERGSVTVTATSRDSGVVVAVSDTGIGIPRNAQSLIFEPFRQVDGSMTRRYGGVGLGLYISRQLVDLLEGKIAVDSEVGTGSTFSVWLPDRTP